MVVFMMIYLSYRLPTAALLHSGQWAISRTLDLAHCPECWVPPPPPLLKSALPYSSQIIGFVLLHIHLLVNYVNSSVFSLN